MDLSTAVKKIGLSEKESGVYLALLSLGPCSVQKIARKAKVARATTYLVLESLTERGLVVKHKESGRTVFSAESPEKLVQYLEEEEQEVQMRREKAEALLPQLHALMHGLQNSEKPVVEYYSGVEGLRTIRQNMMMQSRAGDVWRNFTPVDALYKTMGQDEAFYQRHSMAKGIISRVIFSTSSAKRKRELLAASRERVVERKAVKHKLFPGTVGFTVYGSRIAIGDFGKDPGGLILQSESMAETLANFFDLLWDRLD